MGITASPGKDTQNTQSEINENAFNGLIQLWMQCNLCRKPQLKIDSECLAEKSKQSMKRIMSNNQQVYCQKRD